MACRFYFKNTRTYTILCTDMTFRPDVYRPLMDRVGSSNYVFVSCHTPKGKHMGLQGTSHLLRSIRNFYPIVSISLPKVNFQPSNLTSKSKSHQERLFGSKVYPLFKIDLLLFYTISIILKCKRYHHFSNVAFNWIIL